MINTRFTNENLRKSGQYLMYHAPMVLGQQPRFVARFKHKGPVTMAQFKKELIRNHTVEYYFGALETQCQSPVNILRNSNPDWYDSLKEQWLAKNI